MNPQQKKSISPVELSSSLLRNRRLVWQMTKREVIGRYRGSALGLLWSFFNPLIMLLVYTFVFSVVFKARWDTGSDSKAEFALLLFIGMIAHGVVAECINKAPFLIVSNVNYVKKVIFPLDILAWVTMGATLFHTLISLLVWSAFFITIYHNFHWTAVFFPVVLLPLILFTMGLTWILAALGVYLRDIGQVTGIFSTVLLFMSPIFYPISVLPPAYRPFLYANPLTFIIEELRKVLMWGGLPDWEGFKIAMLVSLTVAWLGFCFFQKTRRGFADVL